ncbi:predicted protein [Botrytis cinerea T4]|uniref:Uncharacterized protein n=1 Tax=Botryotinia fuckeliana (strain T4) TaxID=999810 RepID=G2XQQ5_BOTF4|nr:predicted protein [Botrytis cinerea T4]
MRGGEQSNPRPKKKPNAKSSETNRGSAPHRPPAGAEPE